MLSPLKSTTTESLGPIDSSIDLRTGHKLPAVPLMMTLKPFVCPIVGLALSMALPLSRALGMGTCSDFHY